VTRLQEPDFIIACAVILSALFLDCLILKSQIAANQEFIGTVVGTWHTVGLTAAISYWLGSSAGSKAKTAQIDKLTNGNGHDIPKA
jgi:hypothetical protein